MATDTVTNLRTLLTRAARAARRLPRERAIIAGILIAVGTAWLNGEITKATAVPVIGGIILRFLVSPYDSPRARRRRAERADGIARPPLGRRRPAPNFGDARPGGLPDV